MSYDICGLLRKNPYPGRGITIGHSEDCSSSVMLYFIMGRSPNSRNRVFEKTDDGIRTKAFEPDKLTDPSLVIYHPVRVWNDHIIVTNGMQTDTILEYIKNGGDYRSALYEWEYEPDPPINTARISGIIEPGGSFSLSILKASEGEALCCCRFFFDYSKPLPGIGRFISTYETDGNPPPPFIGEPVPVAINLAGGLDGFASSVWESLNFDNKVSLYARETVIATRETREVIFNKNV